MNTDTAPVKRYVIPEKIHCKAIRIIDFLVTTSDEFSDTPRDPDHYSFSIAKHIAHNIAKNKARYQLFFVIDAMDAEDKPIGVTATISIEFHYEIENLADNIVEEDGIMRFNQDIVATILGMSYSTSRGIILEKLQNTYMGGIILPCINPYDVLKEESISKK